MLEGALELIDNKEVTIITAQPSRRVFYTFPSHGTDEERYFCFDHYCSCPAFKIAVISKENTMAVNLLHYLQFSCFIFKL